MLCSAVLFLVLIIVLSKCTFKKVTCPLSFDWMHHVTNKRTWFISIDWILHHASNKRTWLISIDWILYRHSYNCIQIQKNNLKNKTLTLLEKIILSLSSNTLPLLLPPDLLLVSSFWQSTTNYIAAALGKYIGLLPFNLMFFFEVK